MSFALIIIFYSTIRFKLKSQKTPSKRLVNERKGKTYGEGGGNYCDRVCLMLFASDHYIVLLTVFVWDTAIGFSCEIANYWVITLFQAYANCTVNTCICYAFIGKYRQDLKALFGCHFKRKYLLRQTKVSCHITF